MRKIKIPKIKLNRESTWHITLLVFFVLFVVVFVLNLYNLFEVNEELNASVGKVAFSPLVLNKDKLDKLVAEVEEKQVVFDNLILSRPEIEDPYGEEIVEEEEL